MDTPEAEILADITRALRRVGLPAYLREFDRFLSTPSWTEAEEQRADLFQERIAPLLSDPYRGEDDDPAGVSDVDPYRRTKRPFN